MMLYISDEASSSNFSAEVEKEDLPDLSDCTSFLNIDGEGEEEKWDSTDEDSDSFDPSCKPVLFSPSFCLHIFVMIRFPAPLRRVEGPVRFSQLQSLLSLIWNLDALRINVSLQLHLYSQPLLSTEFVLLYFTYFSFIL
jgi:hypothetical protein